MYGPAILASFLATPTKPDRWGHAWQYNSQSDRHSKVGCWGIALDLLVQSSLLRKHAAEGKVILGVNHPMLDFENNREKALDLVIARPAKEPTGDETSFKELVHKYGVVLSAGVGAVLEELPDIQVAPVGAVLVALEAKAVMTAHVAALPRLYDELNSSHQAVHGASNQALAIGYVQINAASSFASSVSNRYSWDDKPPTLSLEKQPNGVLRVLEKIDKLPRRSSQDKKGFDAIGVTVLDFENMGGEVSVITAQPAPQQGNVFHYESMIVRMANEYDSRFHSI